MQRLHSQLFVALLTFVSVTFATTKTSVAGKVKFPSDNPAFTVEFPSGWTQARDKDGNLDCDPRDDSGYRLSIVILDQVHSQKELKAELPELVKAMGSAGDVKNFKIGDVEGTGNESGVEFAEVKGNGKVGDVGFTVVVTGFEPQKGRFFAMLSAGSAEADKKHAKDYEAIAASIEPLGSKSKGQEPDSKPSKTEESTAADEPSSASGQSGDSQDASTGLPKQYADYLIAPDSRSPDGKFAVMIPKTKLCADAPKKGSKCKDSVVALKPFQILTSLDSEYPEFENKNHGGMHVTWLKDSSAVLVTLDQKWGPNEIFLCEIADGKVTRSTNLLSKVRDLLMADCKKAIPDRADDCIGVFVAEDENPVAKFAGSSQVKIGVTAKTDPKESPGRQQWDGEAQATWDISKAEFTSQKVTRKFAGVRKEAAE